MNKPRKPTANIQAFEREIKRLEKAVKLAKKKGIVFFASPIPEKPARVTKKQLELVKAITPADIRSKGYVITDTGEYRPYTPPKSQKSVSISPPSFTPDITKPSISAPKESEKLTPEQLKQIRSNAAKKAALTRKRREQSDPVYRARMQEIRRRSLQKARETIKQKMKTDASYRERMKKIRTEAAKLAAETRREREFNDPTFAAQQYFRRVKTLEKRRRLKNPEYRATLFKEWEDIAEKYGWDIEEVKEFVNELERLETEWEKEHKDEVDLPPIEPPDTTKPQPEVPIEDLPQEYVSILTNLRSILQGAVNKNIANYLLDLLDDEIDATSEEEVGTRIAREPEWALELADGIAYGSGDSDELANKAYTLAGIILGASVPGYMSERIEELAFEDRPYKRRR